MANSPKTTPEFDFFPQRKPQNNAVPSSSPKTSTPSSNLLNKEQVSSPPTKDQDPNSKELSPPGWNYRPNQNNKNKSPKGLSKIFGKFGKKGLLMMIPLLLVLLIPILIFLIPIIGTGTVSENPERATNVSYDATNAAKNSVTEYALSTGSLSLAFANRLAEYGLEVGYLDTNNNFIAGLRPTQNNSIALASTSTTTPTTTDNSLVIRFKDRIFNASEFAKTVEVDPEVFSAFDKATYGRALTHYNDSAYEYYSTIKSTRNVFQDYITTGNNEKDTKSFRETFSKVFNNASDTNSGWIASQSSDKIEKQSVPTDKITSKLSDSITNKDEVGKYLTKIYSDAESSSEEKTAGNIAMLVNNALNANETYQAIHYYLTLEEPISKTIAGDGSKSPVNQVMNFLTQTQTTEVPDLSSDGTPQSVTGSAFQAAGLSSMLTNTYPTNLASKTTNYAADRVLNAVSKIVPIDAKNLIDKTPTSVTTKSSTLVKDYSNTIIDSAIDSASGAVDATIALITPTVSQSILFNNAADTLKGIPAGEFMARGGAAHGALMGSFTQGGTIGDEDSITKFSQYSQNLLALEAAADRLEHSPFDISSQNTFLGSIFNDITINLLSSGSSLFSTISSFSNLTNHSLLSLLPGASAAGDKATYQTSYGTNCPTISQIGAKGDIYCTPIITFDIDSIKTTLGTTQFEEFLQKNLVAVDSDQLDGSSIHLAAKTQIYTLDKDSDIEKMLTQNNARLSMFGVKDASIYKSAAESSDASNKVLGSIKAAFSKIASLFTGEPSNDFTNSAANDAATGITFKNSADNPDWSTWSQVQTYMTTEVFIQQMDALTSNTGNASIAKYYNPDTGYSPITSYLAQIANDVKNESDTEYLARISGMTTDDADTVLGYISYTSYLASLDYSSYCTTNNPSCQDEITPPTRIESPTTQSNNTYLALTPRTTTIYHKKENSITA